MTTASTIPTLPRANLHKLYHHLKRANRSGRTNRFCFFRTAIETGWLTDAGFMAKLPEQHKAAFLAKIKDKDVHADKKIAPHEDIISGIRWGNYGEPAEIAEILELEESFCCVRAVLKSAICTRTVNAELLSFIRLLHPESTIHLSELDYKPIIFRTGEEIVALIMPIG